MAQLSDGELRILLIEDPQRGWRAFLDQYTPTILALIERSGVTDRDDVGDLYMQVCERLAADECARLRRHDPALGALAAWLTIVVRHAVVDWVRSRAGRRRLFGAVRQLSRFDQQVFELYYWERRSAVEIAGLLGDRLGRPVGLPDVLDALERIERTLSDRHRAQLLALLARTRPAVSLEDLLDGTGREPATGETPEAVLGIRQLDAVLSSALAALPAEDAAIIRLMYVQGWARHEVQRALRLDALPSARIRHILERLRAWLTERRIGPAEAATPGLAFLQDDSP